MMRRKASKTDHKMIINYWSSRVFEEDIGTDWCDADKRCWRCGYFSKLEKCHIIPHSLSGIDDPSNLLLLCGDCHKEAPNCIDPEFMWNWIKSTNSYMYDSFWFFRALKEYENFYGIKPFSSKKFETIVFDINLIPIMLKKYLNNTTIHYSHRKRNLSSIVYVIKQIEDDILTFYSI